MSALSMLLCAVSLTAGELSFPYDAVVRADVVEARSGPGEAYYVTGRLQNGEQVTVHRHDRGGWYMIAPPEGSFSYIRVEHVQTADGQTGTVSISPYSDGRPARAVVRIGSTVSDDAAFSGIQLSDGASVRILGRKLVETDAGPTEMFKIAPPDKEYRWVKGDFIEASGRSTLNNEPTTENDPFSGDLVAEFGAEETHVAGHGGEQPDMVTSLGNQEAPTMTTSRPHNPSPDAMLRQRQQLGEVDDRFRATVGEDPGSWRLDDLERDYRALQEGALTDALVGQIEQRLAAIQRRRVVLDQYEEFIKLTTETSDREQRLLALQKAAGASAETASIDSSLGQPGPAPQDVQAITPPTSDQSTAQPKRATMPRLDGAGLVQRRSPRFPNGPRYALLAPDGRTLAFLVSSAGVNLEQHVGSERGLIGRREFNRQLGGDVIDVQKLVPVRLAK